MAGAFAWYQASFVHTCTLPIHMPRNAERRAVADVHAVAVEVILGRFFWVVQGDARIFCCPVPPSVTMRSFRRF